MLYVSWSWLLYEISWNILIKNNTFHRREGFFFFHTYQTQIFVLMISLYTYIVGIPKLKCTAYINRTHWQAVSTDEISVTLERCHHDNACNRLFVQDQYDFGKSVMANRFIKRLLSFNKTHFYILLMYWYQRQLIVYKKQNIKQYWLLLHGCWSVSIRINRSIHQFW